MCGIAGYWAYSSRDPTEAVFAPFLHSLAHRGPDGFGIQHFADTRLWLGHRRLAIVDLSDRARQPMSYADGRYWLTYNGEVYNYLELREELRRLGHRFLSNSDSEVILAAYAQWGPDCLPRFNGMWAFTIWDAHKRQLFLARDRFGVKPLHYGFHQGAFVFASELKAFLSLPWIDGSFEPSILSETLVNIGGQEATPHTLLPGISRLPAGQAMTVHADGRTQTTTWWSTLDHLPSLPTGLDAQAEQFRSIFFDACRIRLRSDVPLATSLSGGLDSSAVACTLAELGRRGLVEHAPRDWQRAFIACFVHTPYDERQFAKLVVEHAGMVPHYLDVDDQQAVKDIEQVIFDHEGIYWFARVGPWAIYRAMREAGIRVSIDGHGSDELLGGYHSFVEAAMQSAAASLNLKRYLDLRDVRTRLVGGTEVSRFGGLLGEMRMFARSQFARLGILQPALAGLAGVRALSKRLSHPLPGPLLPSYDGPPRLYYERDDARAIGMPTLQAMLYRWFHGSFLPTLLCNFDRASMAHGVEVRMPFMDWRLVTYSFALPEQSKMGCGYTKRILRHAMRTILPEQIRIRTRKIGFVSPMEDWTTGALKPWLADIVASRSFAESTIWNGTAARVAVQNATAGRAKIDQVWPIVNAYVLEQAFKARAKRPIRADLPSSQYYIST